MSFTDVQKAPGDLVGGSTCIRLGWFEPDINRQSYMYILYRIACLYMLQSLVAPPPRYIFGTAPLEHISFQERCLTAYVQELLSLDRARWENKNVNLRCQPGGKFGANFLNFWFFWRVYVGWAKKMLLFFFFGFWYKMWMMKDDVGFDHLFVVFWAKYFVSRGEVKPQKGSWS